MTYIVATGMLNRTVVLLKVKIVLVFSGM